MHGESERFGLGRIFGLALTIPAGRMMYGDSAKCEMSRLELSIGFVRLLELWLEDSGFRGRRLYSRSSRAIKNLLNSNVLDVTRQRALTRIEIVILIILITTYQLDFLEVLVLNHSLCRNMMKKDVFIFRIPQSLWLDSESNFSCQFLRMPVPQAFDTLDVDMSDKNPPVTVIYPRLGAVDCSFQVGVDRDEWRWRLIIPIEMSVQGVE